MALIISPTHYLVHLQLNLLYQFWLHTDLVGKLGPLEWIFNTPTHHKVHHGTQRIAFNVFPIKVSYRSMTKEATSSVWIKTMEHG